MTCSVAKIQLAGKLRHPPCKLAPSITNHTIAMPAICSDLVTRLDANLAIECKQLSPIPSKSL